MKSTVKAFSDVTWAKPVPAFGLSPAGLTNRLHQKVL